MKQFIKKAFLMFDKLDREQIKKILQNIASENELFQMVLYSMTDGVIVVDKEHKIQFVNKATKRLIPFTRDELINAKLWKVVDDREISAFFRDSLMRQEKVVDRTFSLGNGHTRTVACSLMPLVREKRVQGNLIHIEDITEKRAKEARLRRAESLAALTTLAAGVAHEIKNPLGSIGIHIQLIQKQMSDRETIKTRDISTYLNVINEEVNRLNKVILDFLFAVRPIDTELEIRDLNQVVNELLEFLKYELEKAHVGLEVKLGRIPRIEIDEKYLKQALLNIIQNALSAMPEGGTLNVESRRDEDRVCLEITDTGKGIPQDIMDKIFEPYFTTKDFGSGLGLTLVYKIIKEHNGDIYVESKEGNGTTFVLSFPIPQKEKRLLEYAGEETDDEV
ncbi:MAG: PAS domain S-box protein [Spirochaetales bacterium]|nr:PAS domain S-box protein [Spirochaetales bacterium]